MKDKERAIKYANRISGAARYGGVDYLPLMNRHTLSVYLMNAYQAGLRAGRKEGK